MNKVIIVGSSSDLNYKDNNVTKSITELANSIQDENTIFEVHNIDGMSPKQMLFIDEIMKNPRNRLVVLGDNMRMFLDYGVPAARIILIRGRDANEINQIFGQYTKLPKFNNETEVKNSDIKIHRDGTEDLIIKAPKFTDKEPSFNEVREDDFSSKLKRVNKYSYYFGIDKLELTRTNINQNCCFVSDYIDLGNLKENDYIQIDADYTIDNNSAIEFYIIDGEKEVPILPYKENYIQNEKIFYNTWTRFIVDESNPYHVYKDLMSTQLKIEDAITENDGLYTISYVPSECHDYKPTNREVRLKVIIRLYDKEKMPPCINYVNIRKFGDEMIWKDNI